MGGTVSLNSHYEVLSPVLRTEASGQEVLVE